MHWDSDGGKIRWSQANFETCFMSYWHTSSSSGCHSLSWQTQWGSALQEPMGSPVSCGHFRCGMWEHELWTRWETGFPEFANISAYFCPVTDSQTFCFIWFCSQTMALPNVCSSGTFAPRLPDLRVTLVKRRGGCVQQQQLRYPLRGCQQCKALCCSWSHCTGLWPGAISCGEHETL